MSAGPTLSPVSECVCLVRLRRHGDHGSRALLPLTSPYPKLLPLVISTGFILALVGCAAQQPAPPRPPTPRPVFAELQPAPGVPGNPNNGLALFTSKGCAACHTVLGVPNAT